MPFDSAFTGDGGQNQIGKSWGIMQKCPLRYCDY
jgi:hypothetical protein